MLVRDNQTRWAEFPQTWKALAGRIISLHGQASFSQDPSWVFLRKEQDPGVRIEELWGEEPEPFEFHQQEPVNLDREQAADE